MLVLKYPTKIGGILYPKGYKVETIKNLDNIQTVLPGIKFKENSRQIVVHFPDTPENTFTILDITQVEQC